MALIRIAAVVATASILAACSTTQSITPHANEASRFAPWTDGPLDYRIGAGDRLRVQYQLTPELDQEAVVGPDGYIALPSAGRVAAQGATPAELTTRIEAASRAVLKAPVVTLSVIEARSVRVIVGGAVKTAGVYALQAGSSPLEAVVQAGGFQDESRMDQVVLIRQRAGQRAMLRTVDLRRFIERGGAGDSVALQPGDIVFVPRSRIAEADLWVELNLNRLLPFSRSLSYSAGSYGGTIVP